MMARTLAQTSAIPVYPNTVPTYLYILVLMRNHPDIACAYTILSAFNIIRGANSIPLTNEKHCVHSYHYSKFIIK